jgi:hypothetical protein
MRHEEEEVTVESGWLDRVMNSVLTEVARWPSRPHVEAGVIRAATGSHRLGRTGELRGVASESAIRRASARR